MPRDEQLQPDLDAAAAGRRRDEAALAAVRREAIDRVGPYLAGIPEDARKPVIDAMVSRLMRDRAGPWEKVGREIVEDYLPGPNPPDVVGAIRRLPETASRAAKAASSVVPMLAGAAHGLVTGQETDDAPGADAGANLKKDALRLGGKIAGAVVPGLGSFGGSDVGEEFYQKRMVPELRGEMRPDGRRAPPARTFLDRVGAAVPNLISSSLALPGIVGDALLSDEPGNAMKVGHAMGADFTGYLAASVRHPIDSMNYDPLGIAAAVPALKSAASASRALAASRRSGKIAEAARFAAEVLDPSERSRVAVNHRVTRPAGPISQELNQRLDAAAEFAPLDDVAAARGKAGLEIPGMEAGQGVPAPSKAERVGGAIGRGARRAVGGAALLSGVADPVVGAAIGAVVTPAVARAAKAASRMRVPAGLNLSPAELDANFERIWSNPNVQADPFVEAAVEDVAVTPVRDVKGGQVLVNPISAMTSPSKAPAGVPSEFVDVPVERRTFDVDHLGSDFHEGGELFQQSPEAISRAVRADEAALNWQQESLVRDVESKGASAKAADAVGELGEEIGDKEAKAGATALKRALHDRADNAEALARQQERLSEAYPNGQAPSTAAQALRDADVAAAAADIERETLMKAHGRGTKAAPNPRGRSPIAQARTINRKAAEVAALQARERKLADFRATLDPDAQVSFDLAQEMAREARRAESAYRAMMKSADSKEAKAALRRLYELEAVKDDVGSAAIMARVEVERALAAFEAFEAEGGGRAKSSVEMLGQAITVARKRAAADAAMAGLGAGLPKGVPHPTLTASAAVRNVTNPAVVGGRVRAVAQLYDVDPGALAASVAERKLTASNRRKVYSLPAAARELKAKDAAKRFDAMMAQAEDLSSGMQAAESAAPPGAAAVVSGLRDAEVLSEGVAALSKKAGNTKAANMGARAHEVAESLVAAERKLDEARAANPAGRRIIASELRARIARQEAALEMSGLDDAGKKAARLYAAALRTRDKRQAVARELASRVLEKAEEVGPKVAGAVAEAVDKSRTAQAGRSEAMAAAKARGPAQETIQADPTTGQPRVEGLVTDRGSIRLAEPHITDEVDSMIGYLANIVQKAPAEGISNARQLIETTMAKAMSTTSTIAALSPRMVGKLSKDFLALLEADGINKRAVGGSSGFKAWANGRPSYARSVDDYLRQRFEQLLVSRVQSSAVFGKTEFSPTFRFKNGIEVRLDQMIDSAYASLAESGVNPVEVQREALRQALNTILDEYLIKTTNQGVGRELLRSQAPVLDAAGNLAGDALLAAEAIHNFAIGQKSNLILFDPRAGSLASTTAGFAGSSMDIMDMIRRRHGVNVDDATYMDAMNDLRDSFVEAGPELSETAKIAMSEALGGHIGKDVKVFARFGYNESVNTHLTGLKSMREAQGLLSAIGKHARLAVTAGSTSALVNNTLSNIVLGSLMMGEPFGVEFANTIKSIRRFERGEMTGAEAVKWRAIAGSGIMDSSILNDVKANTVSWGATNPALNQLWDFYWTQRSHLYKQADSVPKAALTSMHYDTIVADIDALEPGRQIAFDTGKGKRQVLSVDEAGQLRLDGRAVDRGSQELADAVARQAKHTAADVLFDFNDMALWAKKARASGGALSGIQPLASWFFKAMEKPDGYGIIGHALNFDPRSKYLTDSPTLLMRKSKDFAKLGVRRAAVAAMQESVEDQASEAFGTAMRFDRAPAMTIYPNRGPNAAKFALQVRDNTPSDFSQPFMVQAESALALAKAAGDIVRWGGGSGSAMKDVIPKVNAARTAYTYPDPVLVRDLYTDAKGQRRLFPLLLRMMQFTGDFSLPFTQYAQRPNDNTAGRALRSAIGMVFGGDFAVVANVGLRAASADTKLSSMQEGESAARYMLSAMTRVVAREVNAADKLNSFQRRTKQAIEESVKSANLSLAEKAQVKSMFVRMLNDEVAKARSAVNATKRRGAGGQPVSGEMMRRR